jgi:hypothetical protein
MSTAYVPQSPGAWPAAAGRVTVPEAGEEEPGWIPRFDEVLSVPPANGAEPEAEVASGHPAALNVELRPPPPSIARGLDLAPGQLAITVTIRFDAASGPVALTVVMLRPDFFKVSVETAAASPA